VAPAHGSLIIQDGIVYSNSCEVGQIAGVVCGLAAIVSTTAMRHQYGFQMNSKGESGEQMRETTVGGGV
jgi:hypothetical protein